MSARKHLNCAAGALIIVGVAWLLAMRPHTDGTWRPVPAGIALRPGLDSHDKMSAVIEGQPLPRLILMYADLTGRELWPAPLPVPEKLDRLSGRRFSRWGWIKLTPPPDSGIRYHRDGALSAAEAKEQLEAAFHRFGLAPVPKGKAGFRLIGLSGPLRGSESATGRSEH